MKENNEWWRWISSGFIHKDYGHLAVNMLSFYFFGKIVEDQFAAITSAHNSILFLIFYLSSIVVSGMYDYHRFQNNYAYSALGASGAVSAVIFSYILFEPFGRIYLFFVVGLPAWLVGILYLVYEYSMAKKEMDNIGHNAHFFGAIYGLLFPVIIHPQTALDFFEKILNVFR
jgi:membrane associated rhomboid family serine protease